MTERDKNIHLTNLAVAVERCTGNFKELTAIRASFEAIKQFVNEKTIIDTPSPTDGLQDKSGIETKKD